MQRRTRAVLRAGPDRADRRDRGRPLVGMAAVLSAAALGATLLVASPTGPASADDNLLKDLGAGSGLCIGTAGEKAYNDRDGRFAEVLGREFCAITAENSLKWDAVRNDPDRSYDFAAADALVSLAESRGVRVRGHALNWFSQNPDWVQNANWSRDEAIGVLEDHIRTVVGRYGDRIYTWDVVNEAIDFFGNRRSGGDRPNPWERMIGRDHFEISFRAARAANANARLCYNDDWNDWRYDSFALKGGPEDTGRQGFTVDDEMIALKNRGVPVDCVGIQLHVQTDGPHETDQGVADTIDLLKRRMDRLGRAGIEVDLTEVDVRAPTPLTDASRTRQAEIYAKLLQACLDYSNCKTFATWGISDKESWIPQFYPGYGEPLLFDANYEKKGLYYALRDTLLKDQGKAPGGGSTSAPTTTSTPTSTSGGGPGGGSGEARSGTRALRLAAAGGWQSTVQYVDGLPQNTDYRATIHVKGTGTTQLRVHAGDWGGDLASQDCTAVSSEWRACSATFSTGGSTRVTFRITDSTSGGTVSIDDANLVPVAGGNDAIRSSGFESAADWIVQSPFSLVG